MAKKSARKIERRAPTNPAPKAAARSHTKAVKPAAPKVRKSAAAMTRMFGKVRFGVHPGVMMVRKWVDEMKEKTGRSLEEWMVFIIEKGPTDEADRRAWLKEEHGIGTNSAWWLAERSCGKNMWDHIPEKYLEQGPAAVDSLYSGKFAPLRPLHEALAALGCSLGPDARICQCATMMPLYREHVFAQIKPATLTRIDLGLALGAMMKRARARFPARLIDTGGFAKKDRITHRIPVSSLADIDDELKTWLRRAYELDA